MTNTQNTDFLYSSPNVANRIRERAKERGLPLKDLLLQCNLGSNTLSHMNHGKFISFDKLAKIADALDCSVDYLLGRESMEESEGYFMNNAELAQKLKQKCKEKSLPMTKLLEECQLSKSFIYDLEKRDKTPSVAAIARIADMLDCSVDYLLGRESSGVANSFNGDITMGDIGDKSNVKVNVADFGEKETTENSFGSEFLQEMEKKFNSLNLQEKAEFIRHMYSFGEED